MRQRFDSYARHPTLKDMDYQFPFFRFVNNRCTAEDQTLSTYIILHYLKPLMPYRSLYYTNELPPFTYTQMPSKLIVKLTLHQNRQQKHSTYSFSKINEKYLVVRYGPWQKITHKFSDINIILLDTLTQIQRIIVQSLLVFFSILGPLITVHYSKICHRTYFYLLHCL